MRSMTNARAAINSKLYINRFMSLKLEIDKLVAVQYAEKKNIANEDGDVQMPHYRVSGVGQVDIPMKFIFTLFEKHERKSHADG